MRKPMIYLDSSQRDMYIRELKANLDMYFKRLKPSLSSDPEQDADNYVEDLSKAECTSQFLDYPMNPSDIQLKGLERYMFLKSYNYRVLAMWICITRQLWEQQLFVLIRREIDKGSLSETKVPERWSELNRLLFDFRRIERDRFSKWGKIEELRFLTNVIKHAEGQAEKELRKMRPDMFLYHQSDFGKFDDLSMYHTSINNETLCITENDLSDYTEALIAFWEEFPSDEWLVKSCGKIKQ